MTVRELIEKLTHLANQGHGNKQVQTYTPQYYVDEGNPYGDPDSVYLEGEKVEIS